MKVAYCTCMYVITTVYTEETLLLFKGKLTCYITLAFVQIIVNSGGTVIQRSAYNDSHLPPSTQSDDVQGVHTVNTNLLFSDALH